jgi:hypothetical protein
MRIAVYEPFPVFSGNGFFVLRTVEEINYPRRRRILFSHSRRDEASISRYVSFIATKKAEPKTSKMGCFIFSTALRLWFDSNIKPYFNYLFLKEYFPCHWMKSSSQKQLSTGIMKN